MPTGPNGERRSGNPIARAVQIGKIATGEETDGAMGIFTAAVLVGNMAGGELHDVEAIVDTGSLHTVLPRSLLNTLGVQTPYQCAVTFANGIEDTWDMGQARFEIGDKVLICNVLAGPEQEALLGATTLEAFGLMVDPMNSALVPKLLRGRPL